MATSTGFNVDTEFGPSMSDIFSFGPFSIEDPTAPETVNIIQPGGYMIQLNGTGFGGNAATGYTGTIDSIDVYLPDGTTLVQQVTGLSISLDSFYFAAAGLDSWQLGGWLFRGNDTLGGTHLDQQLYGFAGNDVLNGSNEGVEFQYSSYMEGGSGTDTYNGGLSFDQISFADAYGDPTAFRGILLDATAGTVIDPWGNSETFSSIESFRGCQFNDVMTGSSANEQFMGLGGRDVLNGGDGTDEVRYHRDANRGGARGVTVNLAADFAIDGFGHRDSILNMENVRGSDFNDTITGDEGVNRLRGDAGNDILNGGDGNDTLIGGAGNDTHNGGLGEDALVGEGGNDVYNIDADDFVDEAISSNGAGVDTIQAGFSVNLTNTAIIAGVIENLVLLGSAAANGVGNAANNVINGNAGVNSLVGGDGNDTLNGNAGVDTLNGGNGNDSLNGGVGNDTLTGGAGLDSFVFSTALAANIDRITDYNVAQDTIRIDNAVFAGLAAGVLAATAFKVIPTGGAVDANDRIIYNRTTGALVYDSNGSAAGGAVQFATLNPNLALTNADFIVI